MAILQWVEWLLIPYFFETYFRSIAGAGQVWPGPPIVFPCLKELICYNKNFTLDHSGFSTALLRMSQVKKLDIRTECIEFLRIPIRSTRLEHLRHVVITCATTKPHNLSAFLQCCFDLEILGVSVNGLRWHEDNQPHVCVRDIFTAIERFTSTLLVLKLYMNMADKMVGAESFRQFEGLQELSVNLGMLTNSLLSDGEVIEIVHGWTNKLPPSLKRLHVDQWKEWSGPILESLARQPPAHLPHLKAVTRGDELKAPPSPSSIKSSEMSLEMSFDPEPSEPEIMTMAVRMVSFSEDGYW